MTTPKGEEARRQLDRISRLERRMRQLLHKGYKSISNTAEISALEWAIPILELHVFNTFGKELPRRVSYHKHERGMIVRELWQRDGDICYLCGYHLYYKTVTIDHIVPLAKGGKDDMSNYRLVHPLCNIQKGNMSVQQYRDLKDKESS